MSAPRQRWVLASVALLFVAHAVAGRAQTVECGTVLTPETAAAQLAQERAGAYRRTGGRAGSFAAQYLIDVPVTVHIVRRTNGTGGLPDSSADNSLAYANGIYAPIGIRFARTAAIRYIDNDVVFNGVSTQAQLDALKQTDVIPNSINLYFTPSLSLPDGNGVPGSLCGHSSFTTDAVQGIAFANNCTTFSGNLSTVAHELGHYLDLYHTHETAFGRECPDELNCATTGDLVCDTPADTALDSPGLMGATCNYVGTALRCNEPFTPDTHNLMSYSVPKNCRDRFSGQQMSRALATLLNLRPNLVTGALATVTWVDFGYVGPEDGSFARPYHLLGFAITHTAPGGRVVAKSGTTHETFLSNASNVTLDAFRGPVTVGQ